VSERTLRAAAWPKRAGIKASTGEPGDDQHPMAVENEPKTLHKQKSQKGQARVNKKKRGRRRVRPRRNLVVKGPSPIKGQPASSSSRLYKGKPEKRLSHVLTTRSMGPA